MLKFEVWREEGIELVDSKLELLFGDEDLNELVSEHFISFFLT